ncbi:hypothetical protein ACFYXH_12360 [Streptomyces sp. NPDC002730]
MPTRGFQVEWAIYSPSSTESVISASPALGRDPPDVLAHRPAARD